VKKRTIIVIKKHKLNSMGNNLMFPGERLDITEKEIQEMSELLKKVHGREFSWNESRKAVQDIKVLAEIVSEIIAKEWNLQEKLKEFPKGYHLDESYHRCVICGGCANGENSWYDKYGIKCMICQMAINKKIIPAIVAKNKESWYSEYEMESNFNIRGTLLNKYIKQGIIKVRAILTTQNKLHLRLFLLRDNKDVLPPKKLLQSRVITVDRNGVEYQTLQYWYEYMDTKLAQKLAKYKIINYLKESLAQPIKSGTLFVKSINPLFNYK
jgi:hypothetical protein